MSAVLTQQFRTNNLLSFINAYFGAYPVENMHLFFAKDTVWPVDGDGDNELQPAFDVPVPDTHTVAEEFRTDAISGVRIYPSEIHPVIPRINWELDTDYLAGTVVVTDEWNVYIAERDVIGDNTKPTHIDWTINHQDWGFLYKITEPSLFVRFVTDEWIPCYYVNYQGGGDSNPNPNAPYLAKAYTMMVNRLVNILDMPIEELSEFRRIGLWASVKDIGGLMINQANVYQTEFDNQSGQILYVDNRIPVFRMPSQTEEYRVLIGF